MDVCGVCGELLEVFELCGVFVKISGELLEMFECCGMFAKNPASIVM